jgi:hypothetical protein
MRKRRETIPRLESMEQRVVPSAVSIHVSPATTAQIHKLGNHLNTAATNFQRYLHTLIRHRSGRPSGTSWHPHLAATGHHHSSNLFGIPFIKL